MRSERQSGTLTQDRAYAIRDAIMRLPGWLAEPYPTWGDGYKVAAYPPKGTNTAVISSEEAWQAFRQAYRDASGKELAD